MSTSQSDGDNSSVEGPFPCDSSLCQVDINCLARTSGRIHCLHAPGELPGSRNRPGLEDDYEEDKGLKNLGPIMGLLLESELQISSTPSFRHIADTTTGGLVDHMATDLSKCYKLRFRKVWELRMSTVSRPQGNLQSSSCKPPRP